MLFDKNLLSRLNEKLNAQYPEFNVNIFLLMLEVTSRYIGFPSANPLENYYENFIKKTLDANKKTKNPFEDIRCLKGVYLIMVCFGYLHDTLDFQAMDDQFVALLTKAIESRFATTEEEIDAEQHLLLLLVKNPIEVLKLISIHSESLERENMSELISKRLVDKESYYKEKNFACSEFDKEIFKSTTVNVVLLRGKQRESYLKIISNYLESQRFSLQESLISISQVDSEGSLNQTELINRQSSNANESVNTKVSFIESGSGLHNHSFFQNNKKKTEEVPVNLWHRLFSGSR